MQLRRTKAPATPSQMLDQARQAQADHAAAIEQANLDLVVSHRAIYSEAHDRQQVIAEQITLLAAEAKGLDEVKDAVIETTAL